MILNYVLIHVFPNYLYCRVLVLFPLQCVLHLNRRVALCEKKVQEIVCREQIKSFLLANRRYCPFKTRDTIGKGTPKAILKPSMSLVSLMSMSDQLMI